MCEGVVDEGNEGGGDGVGGYWYVGIMLGVCICSVVVGLLILNGGYKKVCL